MNRIALLALILLTLIPVAQAGKGVKCGNSYISASKTCRIGTTTPAPAPAPPPASQIFSNCTEARAAGRFDILRSDPAYRPGLDRDNDGIACESGGADDSPGTVTPAASTITNPTMPTDAVKSVAYAPVGMLGTLGQLIALGALGNELQVRGAVITFTAGQMITAEGFTLPAAPYEQDNTLFVPLLGLQSVGCTVRLEALNYVAQCPGGGRAEGVVVMW